MNRSAATLVVLAGVVATAMASVGALLIHDLPGVDATDAEVAAYIARARTTLLVAACLWGVAAMATVCLAVGLWRLATPVGHSVIADAAMAAGLVLAGMEIVGFGLLLPLSFRPAAPGTTRLVADTVFLTLAFAGLPSATWTAAASWSLGRSRIVPRWIEVIGYVSAASHLEAAFALAPSGAFSPSGFGAYLAPAAISVWIFGVTLSVGAQLWCRDAPFLSRVLVPPEGSSEGPGTRA